IANALVSLLSSIVGGTLVLLGQFFTRRADDRRQWLLRLHEAAGDLATSYLPAGLRRVPRRHRRLNVRGRPAPAAPLLTRISDPALGGTRIGVPAFLDLRLGPVPRCELGWPGLVLRRAGVLREQFRGAVREGRS